MFTEENVFNNHTIPYFIAMLESQQQSLNPVSPEFIPRNMQPHTDDGGNGWGEMTPSVPPSAVEWNETPASTDSDWQAGNFYHFENNFVFSM